MKVGDRVKVFGTFAPSEGGTSLYLDGIKATVIPNQYGGAGLTLKLDESPFDGDYLNNPDLIDGVHPKQCRKLKKTFKRRIYVPKEWDCEDHNEMRATRGDYLYEVPCYEAMQNFIEFKEVRKKDKS